ncbi:MAG: hypothetical protein RCG16_03890 [Rickettsia hoogstraalii]
MVKINEKGEEIIDEQAINKNILTKEEIEERRQKLAELKEKQEEVNIILKKLMKKKRL